MFGVEGFVFEEGFGENFDRVASFVEEGAGPLERVVDEFFDFGVDGLGGGFRILAGSGDVSGEEDMVSSIGEADHAQFAHSPLADHFSGEVGGLFDVSAGSVGDVVGEHGFGDSSGHDDREHIEGFFLLGGVFVAFGEVHGGSEVGSTGDDGDLVQGVGVFKDHVDDRVTGFVPSGRGFFAFAHGHRAAFFAPADFVAGLIEFVFGDGF